MYEDWLTSKDAYRQGWNQLSLHQYCLEGEQQILMAQMKLVLLSEVWAHGARGLQAAGYVCQTPRQQLLPLLGNDYAIPFTERRTAQRMRESRTRQITENSGMFWMTMAFIIMADGSFEAAIRTALGMSVGNELARLHSNAQWWNQHTDCRSAAFGFPLNCSRVESVGQAQAQELLWRDPHQEDNFCRLSNESNHLHLLC